MKALIQRVSQAAVTIGGITSGHIERGLLVLLGVEKGDTEKDVAVLARKCADLRIFEDAGGKMNLSVSDAQGGMLIVSQFTLCADCRKGNRPSFDNAELPGRARALYDLFVAEVAGSGIRTATGEFGAHMQIHLTNDGPVTILIESRKN